MGAHRTHPHIRSHELPTNPHNHLLTNSFLSILKMQQFSTSPIGRCCPKFTFPTFTPDPNLHTPHIYTRPKFTQTQIYTRPKFTQTQIYTNPFLDIYFNKPKFTQPKFTQNPNLHNPNLRNPNLHKTQIYTTQIYTKIKNNTILLSKFTQN